MVEYLFLILVLSIRLNENLWICFREVSLYEKFGKVNFFLRNLLGLGRD